MLDDSNDRFLTIPEAAQLLRIHRRTLDTLRWRGEGPGYRRHGGRIVYLLSDLLAWSERRARRSKDEKTSCPPPQPAGAGRNGVRRPAVPQGRQAAPGVECEPQRPDRALSRGFPVAPDRSPSHPADT